MKDDEYLRRNLMVSRAIGARANLASVLERLRKNKSTPRWLTLQLQGVSERIEPLAKEMAAHRDAVRMERSR